MSARLNPITAVAAEGEIFRPEHILGPGELAKRLRCKISWVYEATRTRGRYAGDPLPVLHRGRNLLFYWPHVCAWLQRGRGK